MDVNAVLPTRRTCHRFLTLATAGAIVVLAFLVASLLAGCSAQATGGENPSVGVAILQGVGDVAPDALLIGVAVAQDRLDSAHAKGKIDDTTYAASQTLITEATKAATDYQAAVDAGRVVDQAAVNKRVREITRKVLIAAITGKLG